MPENKTISKRFEYIDVLKGFAIFLVVMGHFLAWNFPENIEPTFGQSFVYRLIYSFHMPLFFFLSGYLIDQKKNDWTFSFFINFTKKRTVSLLLPAVTFLLIRFFRFGTWEFQWFLICLFEMQIIFALHKLISKKISSSFKIEFIIFGGFLVCLKIFCHHFSNYSFINFLSLNIACRDFIYFYLGYIAMRFDIVDTLYKRNAYAPFLVLFIASFFISNTGTWGHLRFVTAVSAIIVCVLFVYKMDFSSRISKIFIKYGTSSLAIYLLSPFFIPYFPQLGDFIAQADEFRPANMHQITHISSIFLQLVFGTIIAFYSCSVSLLLKSLFDKSEFLSLILFGKKEKK